MAPLYRIGDATFDSKLSRLECRGESVELQPKLLAVLQHLLTHRDRIVSREELLREVWPDVAVSESSLTRAVSVLRRALGERAAGSRIIATKSRHGYRLVAPVTEVRAPGESREDPFIGRDAALAELELAWERARGGRGAVVLISGDPGIGKTRLASELVARARDAGARALVGFCPPPGGAPALWPWARALRRLAEQEGEGALAAIAKRARVELADLLPELAPPEVTQRIDAAPAQFAVLDSLERVLGALAAERPLVLVIDDLHWADRSSLRALEHVARGVSLQRLLVVATLREGELDDEHPLHAVMSGVTRGPLALRVRLEPLDGASSARLVSALAPGELPARVARAIRERSAGNPLFLRELVRAWTQDGVEPGAGGSLPPGIRDLLGGRIARLPESLRTLLQAAALLGSEIELELLRELVDSPPAELLRQLEAAVAGDWLRLVARAPARYSFAHPLVQDAFCAASTAAERIALHARAARALERMHGERLDPVRERLAGHHLELARGRHPDARAALHAGRAAELAERRLAFDEAARWYERALEALDLEPAPDDSRRGEYLVGVARMRFELGDRLGARAPAEAAAALARRTGDARLLARTALVFWVRGAPPSVRYPHGLALLEEATRAVGHSSPALRAELLARTAEYLSLDYDDAAHTGSVCEEALSLARSQPDPRTLYVVLYCVLFANWAQLTPARRRKLADELMSVSLSLDDPSAPIQASRLHLTCLLEAGDIAAVDAEIDHFAGAIERFEVPAFFRWYGPLYRAMRAALAGRIDEAERLAAEAHAHASHANAYDADLAFATQSIAIRGDRGEGGPGVGLADRIVELERIYPYDLSYTPLRALVLAEAGELDASRALFERFFERYDPRVDVNRGVTTVICAPVCELLRDAARARVIYERSLGEADLLVVNLSAWICLGSMHWPLGKLAALCGDVPAAERHFAEAARRCEKIGSPAYAARARYDHAVLCAEHGDSREALRLAQDALALARKVGMQVVGAQAETLARKLGARAH